MIDLLTLSGLRFVGGLIKSGFQYWQVRNRMLSPEQRLALREKWRPVFETYVFTQQKKGGNLDAIMRDVRRLDEYPEVDEKAKGISPWFRFGLVDTYERGFVALLTIVPLTVDEKTGEWRQVGLREETEGENFYRAGFVPYEWVEEVNWEGDHYYNMPIVFTHFVDRKRSPYVKVAYFDTFELHGIVHYRERFSYEDIRRATKRAGVKFW